MAFRGVDYFCVDSLFSEEELMVRGTARRFAEERVLPVIRYCYRDARFPAELVGELAELGFLGANLEGYGCAGMSNVEYGLIMQELERADSGIRSFVSVQGALVMYPIHAYGSEEQKQKWLPRLQGGKAVGCFGLTEPDFGSNPAGMRATAWRDGDSWVLAEAGLDASKTYIAFEFWTQQLLGEFRGTMPLRLNPASVQLVSLREVLPHPQIAGTSRHFTQGGLEIKSQHWAEPELHATLNGEAGTSNEVFIHMPPGWAFPGDNTVYQYQLQNYAAKVLNPVSGYSGEPSHAPLLRLFFRFEESGERPFVVRFEPSRAPQG